MLNGNGENTGMRGQLQLLLWEYRFSVVRSCDLSKEGKNLDFYVISDSSMLTLYSACFRTMRRPKATLCVQIYTVGSTRPVRKRKAYVFWSEISHLKVSMSCYLITFGIKEIMPMHYHSNISLLHILSGRNCGFHLCY